MADELDQIRREIDRLDDELAALIEKRAAQAKKAGAAVNVKPVDYGVIFPQSGGLPLAQRPAQRKAYRLMELKRWSEHLMTPLVIQPKFFPVNATAAAR